MLRCTLAGLIPLMMSKKYSNLTEVLYRKQKDYFDRIIKNKNYYLIRDLPVEIASQILLPEIPSILSKQKNNGLWSNNSTKVTYDILAALKHINMLDNLIAEKKLKNVIESIKNKYDYESLLIKSLIYRQTDAADITETDKLIKDIQCMQNENGSWENTIVATVYHMEKLLNLGVSRDDDSVRKGIAFLFDHLNEEWSGLQSSGKAYGLQCKNVFSTENRDMEFEAAKKYKKEMDPRSICYKHLGVMQNSFCLKFLIQIGYGDDERIQTALDSIYSILKNYNSLCYFKVQKKFVTENKI